MKLVMFSLALILLFTVSACAAPAAPTPGAPAQAPTAAAGAAAIPEVTYQASDFVFSGPDRLTAGLVAITLENTGPSAHHAQMGRIAEGKTLDDLTAALQSNDENAAIAMLEFVGGPNTVEAGQKQRVITNLSPGTYVLLCFVSEEDNVPHVAKGMIKPVQVEGTAGNMTEPTADVTATMKDFEFTVPATVKSGAQTWRVTNEGPQPHEVFMFRLESGKTMDDMMAFFNNPNPSGPPPFSPAGGIGAISTGKTGWVSFDLEAGDYVALCFVPDPASGKSHAELGMIAQFTAQ